MHNIDRTLQEFETGAATNGEFEYYAVPGAYGQELETNQELEYSQELEYNQELEAGGPTGEQAPLLGELTQELLEVNTEQELNQFLGGLLSQAAGAGAQLLASPAGQSVGRYLINVGKQTLPQLAAQYGRQVGAGLGGRLGATAAQVGGWAGRQAGQWAGTQAGRRLASTAQRVFNLELEMLSPELQELEINRAFVRFATDVAGRAGRTLRRYPGLDLPTLSQQVLGAAVPRYAPGLLGAGPASHGTWVRRGGTIVLYDA